MASAAEAAARLVGREGELAALRDFLETAPPASALILVGDGGIGKTSLWEAGIELARALEICVVSTRALEAEAHLSFAGLIDLLDGVDLDAVEALPPPQRHALDVALRRATPGDVPAEPGAIALAFRTVLRALAHESSVLIAIDDLPWLDAPTADVLRFAGRRLGDSRVRFLLTRRPGPEPELEGALERGVERLPVVPLSLGAVRRLLLERLDLRLSRHLLRRLVEVTLGNPLFAVELGRTLAESDLSALGGDLPLPDSIDDLLGTRVARLPKAVRAALLAATLSGELRRSHLVSVVGERAVEDADDAGVLVSDGDRVRPSHPLLAAAARKRSHPRELRRLHLELARSSEDEELRVRHLALAADDPNPELALELATASKAAFARGARREAVELAEHALRLTPSTHAAREERVLSLARCLVPVGEAQRITALLAPELERLRPGPARARAHLLLASGICESNDEIHAHLERALVDSAGEPGLRAIVLAEMAENMAVIRVERIAEAEAWAVEALRDVVAAGPEEERLVLHALCWTRALQGRPIDDLCRRFVEASSVVYSLTNSAERVQGQRFLWRGEVERAEGLLRRLLAVADERAESYAYALLRLHVCELELRLGRWSVAAQLLDEWAESGDRVMWPMYERCRALLAAGRGRSEEVEEWSRRALAASERTGNRWDWLEALRAQGIGALLAGDPERAAGALRQVWAHTQREGVEDPGVFPAAPDLVEALVELGEADEAGALVRRLRALAERQDHPWGLATTARCELQVRLAGTRYDEAAATGVAGAAAEYARLGLRFDRARTLLALGRAQRRHRRWAAARASLEQAAAGFAEIGSGGWEERARSELERVGARRPTPHGALTPTEERVAALAAQGLSNKQVAAELFVSVNTVEKHLSHAYEKLGVRSRGQLAARLHAAR